MLTGNINPLLDEGWLRRTAFFVKNRDKIRKGLIAIVVVVEAILLIYSGYQWVDYYFLSDQRDYEQEQILTRSSSYIPLHEIMAPDPMGVPSAIVLPGSSKDGRYDVLAKFLNTNPNWVANVHYRFGASTKEETVKVLNDEGRFVVGAGMAESLGDIPKIMITKVDWTRLREPKIFNDLKPKFVVSDVNFISGSSLPQGEISPSQVEFTITNESVYGFWSVDLTVVVLQGDRPIAGRVLALDSVQSAEQRKVQINLFTTITGVTEVLVVPTVDVTNSENLIKETGSSNKF